MHISLEVKGVIIRNFKVLFSYEARILAEIQICISVSLIIFRKEYTKNFEKVDFIENAFQRQETRRTFNRKKMFLKYHFYGLENE